MEGGNVGFNEDPSPVPFPLEEKAVAQVDTVPGPGLDVEPVGLLLEVGVDDAGLVELATLGFNCTFEELNGMKCLFSR